MADIRKNTVHTLEISGYTAEGMGVARLEGRVVFVPCTIQGERWRVRLEKVNKNVAWGRGVELYEGGSLGGLTLRAEGMDLPPDCADQVLALLWERGEVRREALRVSGDSSISPGKRR